MGQNDIDIDQNDLDTFAKESTMWVAESQLKDQYATILERDYNVTKYGKSSSWNLSHVYKSAAMIIFLFSAFAVTRSYLSPSFSKELVASYIESTYIMGNQSVMRKDETTSEVLLLKANEAFVKKNYTASAVLYQQIIDEGIYTDPIHHFYVGVSYLKQDTPNLPKAIEYLDFVKRTDRVPEETNWLLALSYLYNDDQAEAIAILNQIVDTQAYKHKEARDLLGVLD